MESVIQQLCVVKIWTQSSAKFDGREGKRQAGEANLKVIFGTMVNLIQSVFAFRSSVCTESLLPLVLMINTRFSKWFTLLNELLNFLFSQKNEEKKTLEVEISMQTYKLVVFHFISLGFSFIICF